MLLSCGCQSLADIYTAVSETYDPSSTAALPVDRAQPVPRPDKNKSLYVAEPVINLPSPATDMCRICTALFANTDPARKEEWVQSTTASLEPPSPNRLLHITF